MLNWIWLIMVAGSVLAALAAGTLNEVTAAVLGRSKAAVMDVMLPLAGMLVLWMGIMRLVERSGLIRVISRVFNPLMRFLFPDVPANHPALGTIAMNLGATMLGAGNAATPLGLRAMEQLRTLNPHPGVASNAMCMLLALSTSGITLIPASTIALMHARGAAQPGAVIAPSILTTLVATACAVLAAKLLQRMAVFKVVPLPPEELAEEDKTVPATAEKPESAESVTAAPHAVPVRGWRLSVLLLYVASLLAGMLWFTAAPESLLNLQGQAYEWLKGAPPAETLAWFHNVPPTAGQRLITFIAAAAIPSAIGFFVLHAALAGLRVYEELVEGAKEGMAVTFRVIPYVVAILVAIGMFTESGAMNVLLQALRGPLELLRFPVEVLPMAIIRSLSGGAAVGVLDSIIGQYGVNSMISVIAATINGSSETTFYVAALYFGSIRVRRMRHAIPAGLVADAVSVMFAIFFCRLLLG